MWTFDDVFVHVMPLPVHGATTQNEDGSYSVFINANDSWETQRETYRHELYHIEHGDFMLHDANAAELEAHLEERYGKSS